MKWQEFVLKHGRALPSHHMAAIVGQSEKQIVRLRGLLPKGTRHRAARFEALFAAWHGRPPTDQEWPAPKRYRSRYEWLTPEVELLVALVGQLSIVEIADVLTDRLRKITGVRTARRTRSSVQVRMQLCGLQSTDVLGGITVTTAGEQVGSRHLVWQAITRKELPARRVGRLWVIDRAAWDAWKAARKFPPEGYVRLATLRPALGQRSDKLAEYANMGYIPTAERCNPYGQGVRSTQFGTWYVSPSVAKQMVRDYRAGRPMPWYGKPSMSNLKVTWRMLQERAHPTSCAECRQIWGDKGAPRTWEDYVARYPLLAHGEKRHVTRTWDPGLTLSQVATTYKVSLATVRRAHASGSLPSTKHGRTNYVTRSDAVRWKYFGCPDGGRTPRWLALPTAKKRYGFGVRELRRMVAAGTLPAMVCRAGPLRGQMMVLRTRCAEIRDQKGYKPAEVAAMLGVSLQRLRELRTGVHRSKVRAISAEELQVIKGRLAAPTGYSLSEAAAELGKPESWIKTQIRDGNVHLLRVKWDPRRSQFSLAEMKKLRKLAAQRKRRPRKLSSEWVPAGEIVRLAGVTQATVDSWGRKGVVRRRQTATGWRYHRRSVRAHAREYWANVRFVRRQAPAWVRGID